MVTCPCQSQKNYLDCCGRYIEGEAIPPTPEALMRSRYSAYSLARIDYIQATMKGNAAKNFSLNDATTFAKEVTWQGLKIIAAPAVELGETTGVVEFMAYYSYEQQENCLHERSQFTLEGGRWYYTDGVAMDADVKNPGRNDPCPCGSGKKYKKCCAKK